MGNLYLAFYNTTLCAIWGYVLYLTYFVSIKSGAFVNPLIWVLVEGPIKLAQTAAVMEIVHSALGIVKSPVMITTTQVFSRLWVLWGLINLAPEATVNGAIQLLEVKGYVLRLDLVSLLTAWCITEVIRYGFFACKEVGVEPYLIKWLRYSAFLPLYPLGVASELTMAYLALPVIKEKKLWSLAMPNMLNYSFDYYIACLIIIALYLPGLPKLYMYMLSQRGKVLAKGTRKEKAA